MLPSIGIQPILRLLLRKAAPLQCALQRPVKNIPPCPAFADAESRSNAAECLAASAITTGASSPKPNSCSTTAYHDPSAWLRELHIVGTLPPVAGGRVRHACCHWRPA